MAELASGQTLASRFTLMRHLGRGGMGDVWVARDDNLGSQVVTKIVPPGATGEQISLLRQECRNARRLSHPNIVRVHDFHQDPSAVFISMEYVDGGDISDLRGREPQKIIATLLPLVRALEYAHGEGVVHRDLKCSNVLLDRSGQPRLSDFGIAGVLDPESEDLLLSGGGSRKHASPQQLAGEPVSPADDIYGLGALLDDLLGPSPFVPENLRSLVRAMLSPTVNDRPMDMKAVREVLEQILDTESEQGTEAPQVVSREIRLAPPPRVAEVRLSEPVVAPSPAVRDSDAPSRHPYWWLTVTAFLALAAAGFGVFVLLPKWVDERESAPILVKGTEEPQSVSATEIPVEVDEAPEPMAPQKGTETSLPETVKELSPPAEQVPAVAPEKERHRITRPSVETPRPPRVDPKTQQFAAAMSEGLRAFEGGDLVAAKGAFERALSLQPESGEAADGLARTELALRLEGIRQHQTRAEALEGEERWHDAEREYAAALSLDATLRFAKEGKDRAAARAALNDQLEYHIAHPGRLSEESVLEDARGVLATARAIEPATAKLRSQVDRLQGVIKVATTPVRVLLVSDNLTRVVVYKVGRLGTFDSRALDLRPGTYTVVGTREGYRDVRRQLQVVAEGENKPLTVRCKEEI